MENQTLFFQTTLLPKNYTKSQVFNTHSSGGTKFTGSSNQIVEIVFLAQIAVLIILGNVLVILAFAKGPRRIRTFTNYFIINLAVSDILVGCLSVPIWIFRKLGKICLFLIECMFSFLFEKYYRFVNSI